MSNKKSTSWENFLDFEEESTGTQGKKKRNQSALPHGFVEQIGESGIRFLVIDDSSDVIRNHSENFRTSLEVIPADGEHFNVSFWHADKSLDGNFNAFLTWLKEIKRFDAIYLDANLKMGKETGFDLAKLIHETPKFRYQPLCILTANYSNQREKAKQNPHLKLLLKFKNESTLEQMLAAQPELLETMKRKFWADCHDEVVNAIQKSKGASSSVATKLGCYLSNYFQVKAWYFRKRIEDNLESVAMNDKYGAEKKLFFENVPPFLRDALATPSKPKNNARPYVICNALTESNCGEFQKMCGNKSLVIVMRTDNNDLSGIFTIYRDKKDADFTDSDALELQHLVIHLQSLLQSEANLDFQKEVLNVLDLTLNAQNVDTISSYFLPFLHQSINPKRFDDEKCKTSFRIFDCGTGNLIRASGLQGNCTELADNDGGIININDVSSTIAKAVFERKTLLLGDIVEETTIQTTTEQLSSALVVPLKYDGAVFGALNMESSVPNKFNLKDVSLAEKFSNLVASKIFSQRSEQFLQAYSTISKSLFLNFRDLYPTPDLILQNCISALYKLCFFSDLLLISTNGPLDPKKIKDWRVSSWTASAEELVENHELPVKASPERINKWKQKITSLDTESYLYKCLSKQDGQTVYFTDHPDEIAQEHDEIGLRPKGRKTLSQIVIRIFSSSGITALCLLFETRDPFTKGLKQVVAEFAEFISYLQSIELLGSKQIFDQSSQYETKLFMLYATLMHAQNKVARGIVSELEKGLSSSENSSKVFERVKKKASLIQKNSDIQKAVLEKDEAIEEFDISILWQEITEGYQTFLDDNNSTVNKMSSKQMVKGRKSNIKCILSILIDNSHQYAGKSSKITLIARSQFELIYEDNGSGIQKKYRHKVFDHFSSTERGSGTGLIIAKLLAKRMGGNIELISENTEDIRARFRIKLK